MHELSLARSVLDVALEHAEKHNAIKIGRITLSFGKMSCIQPDALETAFEVMARGTRAEGAVLTFEIIPAVVSCLTCDRQYDIEYQGILVCPVCGDPSVLLVGGTEDLSLIQMEVEQEE
jgi:hydrogenase nickel incorporation protein HypA/HybF